VLPELDKVRIWVADGGTAKLISWWFKIIENGKLSAFNRGITE
jgi:hypothetical protein